MVFLSVFIRENRIIWTKNKNTISTWTGAGMMFLLPRVGGKWGCYINMGKHLRILLLAEVIIRVDRTGIYTIERDQMVEYYV